MFKINLAPEEQLENKFWFVPMLVGIVALFFASDYVLQIYLEELKNDVDVVSTETAEHQRGFEELRLKQAEFKVRDSERNDLENRLAALQRITESKILRYRPVILLEHLQNLKPEGIWFSDVTMLKSGEQIVLQDPVTEPNEGEGEGEGDKAEGSDEAPSMQDLIVQRINTEADKHEITIKGRAFDNILVAEFMSALKSTQSQEVDPTSLRTMVYFSEIKLKQTQSAMESVVPGASQQTGNNQENAQGNNQNQNQIFAAAGIPNNGEAGEQAENEQGEKVTQFEITLKFREHQSPLKGSAMQTYSFQPNFKKKFTMY